MPPAQESKSFRFDVAFSFAGPHRDKVRAIAEIVRARLGDGKVFFDEWFEHEILGSDMDVLLQRIYHERSLMVVADLSDDYAARRWPQAEARAIRALRMEIDTARNETARLRLINVRFDEGDVPGVLVNEGWYEARSKTPEQCAEFLVKRHALLQERMGAAAADPPPLVPPAPSPVENSIPILFFHPATNDDRYSRRENELNWLDKCAKNPGIRIATVTGQGGLGKTSLVGHWIEKHHGWQHRPFRGVLFYSFYSNRDPKVFFGTFLKFVCEMEKIPALPKDTPLHHLAAFACKKWSYLVVLDGLEVLQHGEDDPHYGWIADGELTEFVARVGAEGASLLVLTSRFSFPRITDEHPAAARALELPLFTNAEGADLLAACGLNDPRPRLEGYSELLGGHPLALRIFAGACREQPFDDPEKVSRDVRSAQGVETMPDPDEPGLSPEERQKRQQQRQFYKLLRWFQQKLSPPKRRLLQLVALFRDPVRTDTLAALALGLDAMKADFVGCDTARITGLLDQLSGQFLLQRETSAADDTLHWTAHPIVRDVFREAALAAGDTVAKQFAEIVAGKDEGKTPKTVAEVLPIVEAIEVLLATRDFKAADELDRERLDNGRVFRFIPAPKEGLRSARAFLEPMRRVALEKALGRARLAHYFNEAALYASILGEMDGVVRGYGEHNVCKHEASEWENVSTGLRNIADVQIHCGNLRDAMSCSSEALFYSGVTETLSFHFNGDSNSTFFSTSESRATFPIRPTIRPQHDEWSDWKSRTRRANVLSFTGQLVAASREFIAADTLRRNIRSEMTALRSTEGVWWSHHRLQLGEIDTARQLTQVNYAFCEENSWNNDLARCDLLLGDLDLRTKSLASASHRIARALSIFRDAHQGKDLPDALLAMARVRQAIQLARNDAHRTQAQPSESPSAFTGDESALSHCEESLRLAARSGFLLKKCDALNFRALLLREFGQPEKALADAKEAHDIAQRCDYYWGLHEALRQLRDTAKALNRTAEFREWDKAERDLTDKMKPEIVKALRINREHDAEMERLYGKKKK